MNLTDMDPFRLADFLGRGGDSSLAALANEHLPIVTAMVKAYVRGQGFTETTVEDDLAAVIVTSTARLMANPEYTESQTVGNFSIRHGTFNGWTLPELAVLHQYRRRTA